MYNKDKRLFKDYNKAELRRFSDDLIRIENIINSDIKHCDFVSTTIGYMPVKKHVVNRKRKALKALEAFKKSLDNIHFFYKLNHESRY